ncbi:MAG: amidohydrolase family protein [Saprospiraceae bacterium]
MNKITADFVFDGFELYRNAGIIYDQFGVLQELHYENSFDKSNFSYYPGLLTPGFINTHCHLELSHLQHKFNSGTGLLSFLNDVVKNRAYDMDVILEAIKDADNEMFHEGIVAVGDISNKTDTIKTKINSKIKYYNFIECFDFLQEEKAHIFLESYRNVYTEFGSLQKSLVPHAPYTVSKNLFSQINLLNSKDKVISIHNQEVQDEDQLFINNSGGFENFFGQFGFAINDFEPIGKSSIHYTMNNLSSEFQTILVHNTCMQESDISSAIKWNPNLYFTTCPNANLFIENKLPNYRYFIDQKAKICIGTDSLSSNWRLSILEEIKTIQKYQSYIPLMDCLQWATINGARALKMDDELGSFTKNKKPGINWIQAVSYNKNELKLNPNAVLTKLI